MPVFLYPDFSTFINCKWNSYRPWWLSGAISNSRRENALGPRFKSRVGHIYINKFIEYSETYLHDYTHTPKADTLEWSAA